MINKKRKMNKKSVILFAIAVLEMILYIFINETMYIGTLKSFDELYLYQLISILIFEIVEYLRGIRNKRL